MVDQSLMKTTILLLVSDPVVRSILKETLECAGYIVLAAGDLGTAVDRLKECTPDLLITRTYVAVSYTHLPPPREKPPPRLRAGPMLEYPWSLCVRAALPSRTPPKALRFWAALPDEICRLPIRSPPD